MTCSCSSPHVDVRVTVDGRRFRGDPLDASRSANESGVAAPMPGRVVRVLVKPGDEVTARQGLVIIEAMKMENELAAPRDGRVSEVLVSEGQSVEAGRLLVRLDKKEVGTLFTIRKKRPDPFSQVSSNRMARVTT